MKSIKIFTLLCATALSLTSCNENENDITTEIKTTLLFTSNNSDGNINIYNVNNINSVTKSTLTTTANAADGIYYNSEEDILVQASRSSFGLEGYAGISLTNSIISTSVTANVVGSLDMVSPRELAVNEDYYVVADNADVDGNTETKDGRLFVYVKNDNQFELRNTITTNFNLWGITFIGNDLYAIVDNTNELAVFSNFLNTTSTGSLNATKQIAIEGIVRTHGLTYDSATDTMILTDIGDATNGQDDGGFQVIANFTNKFNATSNGNTLALSEQTRVSGSNTLLGNPVDVSYDGDTKTVYIAEAGNGGGRILAFNNINTGGNLTPSYNSDLTAASAVYLYKE